MALVKGMSLSFPASDSPDVVSYKLYMEEAPTEVTYDSPIFDLGLSTTVDLATLPGMTTKDGIYNLAVSAVDDVGNESSMSKLDNVPLDFVAPNPPGQLTVVAL